MLVHANRGYWSTSHITASPYTHNGGSSPPHSPDLNPIESAFSKIRRLFESAAHRTIDAVWRNIQRMLDMIRPNDAAGYFRHCGYRAIQ